MATPSRNQLHFEKLRRC